MQLLKKVEAQDLSGAQLVRMTKGKARAMRYDDLRSVTRLEQLFDKTNCVIVLLQIQGASSPVGHWIALIKHNDHIEHFDSYGLSVDQEIALTYEQHYLSDLIDQSRTNVVTSQKKLQAVREHVNTCGRWCVLRCLLRNLNMRDFYDFISSSDTHPDMVAALTTIFL